MIESSDIQIKNGNIQIVIIGNTCSNEIIIMVHGSYEDWYLIHAQLANIRSSTKTSFLLDEIK